MDARSEVETSVTVFPGTAEAARSSLPLPCLKPPATEGSPGGAAVTWNQGAAERASGTTLSGTTEAEVSSPLSRLTPENNESVKGA